MSATKKGDLFWIVCDIQNEAEGKIIRDFMQAWLNIRHDEDWYTPLEKGLIPKIAMLIEEHNEDLPTEGSA
jgi:hypothetical protein